MHSTKENQIKWKDKTNLSVTNTFDMENQIHVGYQLVLMSQQNLYCEKTSV